MAATATGPGALALSIACALGAAGCLIGFDGNKLRGGGDGGAGAIVAPEDAGSGGASVDLGGNDAAPATAIPACEDFSAYATGASVAHWLDGRGAWRVVAGPPRGLGQTTAPAQRTLYLGWYDATDWRDQTVTAIVNPADNNADDCVLARVTDSMNYYQLCVGPDGGRQGSPSPGWKLKKVVAGNQSFLAGGSISAASSHTLSLSAQGSTLTVAIDGAVKPALTDGSLASGAAGLASESTSVFTSLCAQPM